MEYPAILSFLNKDFVKNINYIDDTDLPATKKKKKKKVIIKKSAPFNSNQQKISNFSS